MRRSLASVCPRQYHNGRRTHQRSQRRSQFCLSARSWLYRSVLPKLTTNIRSGLFDKNSPWIGSYERLRRSHILAVPSTEPETATVPSSFSLTQLTRPAWPRKRRTIAVLGTSHRSTCLSRELNYFLKNCWFIALQYLVLSHAHEIVSKILTQNSFTTVTGLSWSIVLLHNINYFISV